LSDFYPFLFISSSSIISSPSSLLDLANFKISVLIKLLIIDHYNFSTDKKIKLIVF